ncbi:MAG: efflux RND transporter periplasmic adaptor subunit [Gammaproteobacteria bacterium]
MNRKTYWLVLSTFALLACQPPGDTSSSADKDEAEKAPEPVPVEIASVGRGTVNAVYVGTATLEADGEAQVKAKVGGEIVQILVEEGDIVKAGQPLAKIEDSRLRLELARAKANVDKVAQDYQRNIELHDKGLLPAGTFEGLRFDLDALKATYKLNQLELSYTTIRAPISGVVSQRVIKVGNNVNIGEAVFTITDLDPLLAYLHVPEKDFQKLRASQQVNLAVDAMPGKPFIGSIARVSPVVDAATGTFKVTIEVNDESASLKPGMFGRVAIIYDTFENAVLLPRGAVVESDGQPSVFVAENGKARQQAIITGHISGKNIQVIEGLTGSEKVVVIGQNGLKDDGPIKVVGASKNNSPDAPDAETETAVAQSST